MRYGLLIGINYIGTQNQLNGCINDTINIKNYLITHRGYMEENIILMNDNTDIKPTYDNIIKAINELTEKSNQSDEIFFHYSGHGVSINDFSNDETDNMDECIVPLDHKIITDDILRNILINKISSPHAICIIDACHSGTSLDLQFRYSNDTNKWIIENNQNVSSDVIIYMFSGCDDSQTSADAWINKQAQGALTYSFLHVLEQYKYNISLKDLILEMNKIMINGGYTQRPQFSCNKETDVNLHFI